MNLIIVCPEALFGRLWTLLRASVYESGPRGERDHSVPCEILSLLRGRAEHFQRSWLVFKSCFMVFQRKHYALDDFRMLALHVETFRRIMIKVVE